MKRGFTLVELLAVIAILAIISLIAVPIVIGIINDSKNKTNEQSIELYGRAIENAVGGYFTKYPEEEKVTFKELEDEKLIEYKGANIECEMVSIIDRDVYLSDCTVNGTKVDYEYAKPVKNMLYQKKHVKIKINNEEVDEESNTENFTNNYDYRFLNTEIESKKIETFEIKTNGTTIENSSEYDSIDCSYNQDKSVMCYWKENEGYYDMVMAADGEIYTPYDSRGLFFNFGYDKLETLDLTGLNTKYTVNMREMFAYAGCNLMSEFVIGNTFDTSNVIDMTSLFYDFGVKQMQELDLGDKFNTSNVINMRSMFNGTGFEKLNSLSLGDKFDTSNVEDMAYMFNTTGAFAMTSLDLGDKFDTSNVEDTEYMFNFTGAHSMESLNLGDKFDTSNVKNMEKMFYRTGWVSMASLRLGNKFDIPDSAVKTNMFSGCGKNKGNSADIRIYVKNEIVKNKIKNLSDDSVPELWKTNDNIIQVQPN